MMHTRMEIILTTLTLCSLLLLAFYVHGIYLNNARILSEYFYWIFAVIFSASLTSLYYVSKNRKLLLSVIFVSAFVIVSLRFLRFNFYGDDLVGELFAATTTRDLGRWPVERVSGRSPVLDWTYVEGPTIRSHRYFSTVSVTILPSVMSQITGAPMATVFAMLMPIVSATVVLIAFLITELCFGQKIALLTSIVFIFSNSFVGRFPNLLREDIAILFFLTIVYCALWTQGSKKRLIVSFIAVLTLTMAHYGTTYFAIFGLSLIFISTWMYDRITISPRARPAFGNRDRFISVNFLMYSVAVVFVWLLVIAYPILVDNIIAGVDTLKGLLAPELTRQSYFQSYLVFSSLGVFHTIIQWSQRILALCGFVVVLRNYRNKKEFSLVLLGGGMLALLVFFAVLPNISLAIGLDRVLNFALLGYSIFIAILLVRLEHRFKNWSKFISFFIVMLFFLEAIEIPILYSVPSDLSRQEFVFSFSRLITYYEASDFQFADFAQKFTNTSAVFAAEHRGSNVLLFAESICVEPRVVNSTDAILLIESGKTDYFLALMYLPDYLQFKAVGGGEVVLSSEEVATLFNGNCLNRIYDNARVLTFSYVYSSGELDDSTQNRTG